MNIEVKNMEIEVTNGGSRIDSYLSLELDISRSKIQKLIKEDKVLVNGVLIILACDGGRIPMIVPVIIITRDIVVDSIKMIAGSKGRVVAAIKSGKLKTACLMTGIALTLFYNMPFEFINLRVSDGLLLIATILCLYSGIQYYILNKELIFED